MTLPWWTGVPPAHATVTCQGQDHRLIWEDGRLSTPDHADAQGERALMALGGERLPCIEMLDAWERHASDPEILLLGPRGAGDVIARPQDPPHRPGRAGTGMSIAAGRASPVAADNRDEEQLARLLSLSGGLGLRLTATVAAHWRERLQAPDADTDGLRARLHAALYGRVLAAAETWLGRREVEMTLEMVPEGGTPSLRYGIDGTLTAALPFGWLVDVHARDAAVVWGRFCLSARGQDGRTWDLATVAPDLGAPQTITLALPG